VTGVAATVASLPYRRCVCSSSAPERLRLSLEVTGLAPLFEHVFSAVEVARGKPAPDLYLLAARTMGEPPARCIVIEDAVRGVMAGRAAGARVIGFAGGTHASTALADDLRAAGAEVVIRSMHELPAIVRRLAT
jgi:HAD superfamily hydrolase (TIGR01509 family)